MDLPIPSREGSQGISSEGDGAGHIRHAVDVVPSAQDQVLAVENPRKRMRAADCPGRSERTLSRQKLARRKLAAQGFTTLPDFLRQKREKAEREGKLAALVAAAIAARPRSARHVTLEEEEGSGDDSEMVVEKSNPMPCVIEVDSEPIEVEDSEDEQMKSCCTVSLIQHLCKVHAPCSVSNLKTILAGFEALRGVRREQQLLRDPKR